MTYPTIRPAITLDFQKSRKLDPRITVSRSSSATYLDPASGLIKTAPDGVARFEKEGLLIEESRTNLVSTSTPTGSGLGNGWTQRANTTITTNADVAPDGTTTATSVVPNIGSTDYAYTRYTLSPATTADCVVSAFAKPLGSYTKCVIESGHASGGQLIWKFDFTTGVPSLIAETGGFAGFGSTAFMEPLANGWWRVGFTGSSSLNTMSVNGREGWASGGRPPGDGVSGALFWGCQIEEGGFQTSFIPTAASTVTRAADVASIAGTNFSSWYNQSEGTWSSASIGDGFIFTVSTDADNRYYLVSSSGNGYLMKTAGVNQFIYSTNSFTEAAIAYSAGSSNIATDSILQSATASITVPTVNALKIGMGVNNDFQGLKRISRLSYYPERVSDASLQELTS
jgi:hypothetical protein